MTKDPFRCFCFFGVFLDIKLIRQYIVPVWLLWVLLGEYTRSCNNTRNPLSLQTDAVEEFMVNDVLLAGGL